MDIQSYNLTAGVNAPYLIPGRFFMLVETQAPVTVRFRRGNSRSWEVASNVERGYISEPGDWSDPDDKFDGFELVSATTQTVRLAVSYRKGDYRQTLPEVRIESADDFATADDVAVDTTPAVIAAANANRRKLIVQHVSGAGVVRIGDDQIADDRGGRLQPSGSYTVHSTGALYARTESGAAVVSILEEVKA